MWNEGYISEVDYIHGYFSELSPARLNLALLSRGIAHSMSRSPIYLELGFGQGLTLAINAATSSGRFCGTDFNPSQVASAAEIAAATGKPVDIFEDSFEELASREGLPRFDVIALHGIWSWVPDQARRAIVDLARAQLKPGGVFYVSYNVMPGWSSAVPLRHMLSEYSRRSATGGILSRVDQSIRFVEQMMEAGAAYFEADPRVAKRLEMIKSQNRSYVSHEYFNRHWLPMSFLEVSDALCEAKLAFGGSSNILDNIESIGIPDRARAVLDQITDQGLREMAKDYFVNQQFRRDIFVKGARQMTRGELLEQVREQEFLAVGDIALPPRKVQAGGREATLLAEVYDPIYEEISKAPEMPLSVRSLAGALPPGTLSEWQIWEALLVLAGSNFIAPVTISETPEADIAASQSLNRELCRRSAFSGNVQFLAAPRIGAATAVSRIEQLFLLARAQAAADPAEFAAEALETQGERIVLNGAPVEDSAEMREHLRQLHADFQRVKLPMLVRMGSV